MPIYKAPNNDTYRLDSAEQIDRLPAGCVEITEQELAQIIASRLAPQITVPQSVTRFQALAALHISGNLAAVQAIMAAPETPVLAKLAWDNALSFERSSPLLDGLAGTLGLTSQDLDELFTTAAGIEA